MKQKTLKQFVVTALAACLLFTTPLTANAATATKATNISVQSEYTYNSGVSDSGAIYVKLDEPGDYITNIKSKNSSLTAKLVYAHTYYYQSESSSTGNNNYYAIIGLYAKKNLTTSVTFDIYGENNQKKESKTVKVTAKGTSYKNPVKTITFGGKPVDYYKLYSAKKGKLKVTMNKNFKLLKVEVGTYTSPKKTVSDSSTRYESEMVYKKVKNNSKITLGKYGYYYSYSNKFSNGKQSSHYSSRILAPTEIRITYQDKKTKTTGYVYYIIHKLAN